MPGGLKVIVRGGRDFDDRERLYGELDRLHDARTFRLVIAGGARGADTLAVDWARFRGVAYEVYMADWKKFRRRAGPIRNQRMLVEGKPDLVVAFAGGHGTAGMVALAREAGVEIIVIPSKY